MTDLLPVPPVLNDGWQTASPAQRNLKSSILQKLRPKLQAWPGCNVHAVVVARGRRLVFEEYFTGEDWAWDRPFGQVTFGPDVLHDLRNMTSAAVSLMMGKALWYGDFESLQDKVGVHLQMPQHFPAAITELSVGQVLSMATGHAEASVSPGNDALFNSPTHIPQWTREELIFGQARPSQPGSYVRNDYMMAAILLFLAIKQKTDFQRGFVQGEFFNYLETKHFEWPETAINRLRMRPRDVAKLGQLILNKGRWMEDHTTLPPIDPVVPPEWFEEYRKPSAIDSNGVEYAYQWRFGSSNIGGEVVQWLASFGDGGQRIFVVPSRQLVVVVMAGIYDHPGRAHDLGQSVLEEFVLPACD